MKTIAKTLLVALVATLAPTLASAAETPDHPGVAGIQWSSRLDGRDAAVTVHLNHALLRFMSAATAEATAGVEEGEEVVADVKTLINQIWLVRVEVYNDLSGVEGVAAAIDEEVAQLTGRGWQTVVRARDGGEGANILMLTEGDAIAGLVVIAGGGDELAFVNVAGDLDPELVGRRLGAVAREVSKGKIKIEDLLDEDAVEVLIQAGAGHAASEDEEK